MTPLRADMIVVACVLIDFVLKTYELTQIRASAYALEGRLAGGNTEARMISRRGRGGTQSAGVELCVPPRPLREINPITQLK